MVREHKEAMDTVETENDLDAEEKENGEFASNSFKYGKP